MADIRTPNYPHRQNPDGSFDSICPACFATVANAKDVKELKIYEKRHICDGAFLADRGVFGYPSMSQQTVKA